MTSASYSPAAGARKRTNIIAPEAGKSRKAALREKMKAMVQENSVHGKQVKAHKEELHHLKQKARQQKMNDAAGTCEGAGWFEEREEDEEGEGVARIKAEG